MKENPPVSVYLAVVRRIVAEQESEYIDGQIWVGEQAVSDSYFTDLRLNLLKLGVKEYISQPKDVEELVRVARASARPRMCAHTPVVPLLNAWTTEHLSKTERALYSEIAAAAISPAATVGLWNGEWVIHNAIAVTSSRE